MFDQLGTLIRPQWDEMLSHIIPGEFGSFDDIQARIEHLRARKVRQESMLSKLQKADDSLGGTSLRGNPGASSQATTANPNPDPSGPPTPTVVGGDLPWLDTPEPKNELSPRGAIDDALTSVYVMDIKEPFREPIRRRRENMEMRLKKTKDTIEQIDLEIAMLEKAQEEIPKMVATVEKQFSESGSEQSSGGGAEPPVGLLEHEKRTPKVSRFRNLFRKYPATRTWPVFPIPSKNPSEPRANV